MIINVILILNYIKGLIYLLQTHNNACSPITQDFYNNEDLYNFYKNNGIIMSTRGQFLNFEVVWVNQKLHLTEDFFERIEYDKSVGWPKTCGQINLDTDRYRQTWTDADRHGQM